jgi:hypothetical protein
MKRDAGEVITGGGDCAGSRTCSGRTSSSTHFHCLGRLTTTVSLLRSDGTVTGRGGDARLVTTVSLMGFGEAIPGGGISLRHAAITWEAGLGRAVVAEGELLSSAEA